MISKALVACLLAGTVLAGIAPREASAGQTLSQKAEADTTVKVPNDDPAMAAAFERARATLPGFFDTMGHPAATMRGFAVKVGLPTRQGTEFVWLSSPSMSDGQIHGIINNELEYASDYHKGQRVEFPGTSVVDWMYIDAGKMRGNFTACAIASKLSQREQREFEQQYRIDCAVKR